MESYNILEVLNCNTLERVNVWYCWTSNRPAWSKIEGRLQKSKYWNLLIRTARWVVSQTRVLQRSNPEVQHNRLFIICVAVRHLLGGRQNRPTLLQHSSPLSTDTKHSTVMYVCGGIFPTSPWYRMFLQCVLLCFLCACSFFKHYVTLHSTMYQKTHQLQLIALYSQQAL